MRKSREVLACLVLFLVVLAPGLEVAALPPLAAATFPVGSILVPMDNKQGDRIHVYGFIHEFLRLTPNALLARIIEPPDVSIQTTLTPSGAVYQGGPFLIDASLLSAVNTLLATKPFTSVTVTRLTASLTSDKVFFVRQPTRILVIRGIFGRTDLTLNQMGINYTIVSPDTVVANPSIVNQYSLIVVDCPGWYGNPNAFTNPAAIQAVYTTIRTHVQAGNEVIFTDIAMLDLNQTFPGYVNLAPGGSGSWVGTVYNPPKGDNFPAEFPSQYYNPGTSPNTVKIFTEGGGWVISSIKPAHTSDVRILLDSTHFGVPYRYAILGYYFQVGNGIVEGLAFHPQQQLYPIAADVNGYYAVYELYGNKFVHGPQLDFLISATPSTQTIHQGLVATYSVTVTSIGSFNSPVALQMSSAPSGLSGSFSPIAVTPPPGGAVNSALTIPTSLTTPLGTYNLTITGTSTFPLISHSTQVQLNITRAPADFSIDAKPKAPTPLILNPGQCGNITVSITSIGNFSAPVNLTLTNRPSSTQATSKFVPNPITPTIGGTVLSNLTFCVLSGATPANYTMTVVGTSPAPNSITHTVDVLLRVPKPPPGPAINPLIYLILLALLLLALGLALLAFALSRRRVTRPLARAAAPVVVPALVPGVVARPRPPVRYVLPLPTVRCRFCGRIMPLHSLYCPYCGRPQATVPSGVVVPAVRPRAGRRVGMGFILALLSGILVLLNAAVLLVPSVYATWSSIFWWLPTIGPNYAFVLGLVIGLVLLMGCIIMVLGQGAFAAVIIFPFAVFSLIIGGGFVAGMILGVLGGILGVMKR
jgi:hypothetical protein